MVTDMLEIDRQEAPVRLERSRVRRFADRAAPGYEAAAVLAREVDRRMQERLQYVKHAPEVIVDAGCGPGSSIAPLRARYPRARLVAIDLSVGMLRQAARSGGGLRRWLGLEPRPIADLVCADVAALPLAGGGVDLVYSNLVLHACEDLPKALAEWRRVLRADGLAMFSLYGPDTLGELRRAFASVDGHAHTARFPDMHDVGDMLLHAGFADPVMDVETFTLTYAAFGDLARDLARTGERNAAQARHRGLYGKGRWARVARAYEVERRDGRLPATFEVVYGHAWRAPTRTAPDGRAVIRVQPRARGR